MQTDYCQKELGCEKHDRRLGKPLSLKLKNYMNGVPVFLCKKCKKIYVNKHYNIGNIRGLTYNGRYYPVEKVDGPEVLDPDLLKRKEIEKEHKRKLKKLGIEEESAFSEYNIGRLAAYSGYELKFHVYSVIRELNWGTKHRVIKWRIKTFSQKYADDNDYYIVYEMVGKEYITFSSAERPKKYRLCEIPCVCFQDCQTLERRIYRSFKKEKKQSLDYRLAIIDKSLIKAKSTVEAVSNSAFRNTTEENGPVIESQNVGFKDFVVRRDTFKCLNNNHEIKNIEAIVKVLRKKDGAVVEKKLSAGFCPKCNVYFILESTYESLKMYGIPLCRTCDERNYLLGKSNNHMRLASESILMQFGYNVSQGENLSETIRHKILANIIDNQIMSKSDITSYLDFFINQRAGQSRYVIAISKWEKDKEFIAGYRQGEYSQYGVNAIYR